jgi:hypothetical protein
MATEKYEKDDGWETKLFEKLTGGIDYSVRTDGLKDEEATIANNVIFYNDQVRVDTGYTKFAQTVIGSPRAVYQLYYKDGSSELLLVTNSTLYILAASEWQYVSSGVDTTASVGEAAGSTAIDVTDTAGFTATSLIGIILDNGTQHRSVISSITPGAPGVLNIAAGIPGGRTVAIGALVVQAVALSGTLDKAISLVTLPFNDWLVFTNGIDKVKRYNGTDCIDVPNLPSAGNTVCRIVQLFNNYLLLINTIEGGTAHPQRVRRCDTSDPTNWSTGNAGLDDLYGSEDFIVGAEDLGPYLVLYRERSIVRMEFVGTVDLLFNYDDVISGEGTFSQDLIVNLGDYHIFFGNANVYEYRGGYSMEPIGDELYGLVYGIHGELNPTYRNRAFTVYVEELDEILLFYPAGSSTVPNHVVRYKPSEQSWATRQFSKNFVGYGFFQEDSSRTWASLVGSWLDQGWAWNSNALLANTPITLLCDETNQVYSYDYVSGTDDGTGIAYALGTKDLINPRFNIRTDRLSLRAKGSNISVERSLDRGASWTVLETVNPGATPADINIDSQVVSKSVRYRLKGTGGGFALDWMNLKYRLESEY